MSERPIIFSAPQSDLERLWSYVTPEPNSGCWLWTGAINDKGYGRFGTELAHRASFRLAGNRLSRSKDVHHKCKVRCCVNPEHLELVTHRENLLNSDSPSGVAARTTHCPSGHLYEGQNVSYTVDGKRVCKLCDRNRNAKLYRRKSNRKHRPHVSMMEQAAVILMIEDGIPHSQISLVTGLSLATISNHRRAAGYGR